MKALSYHLYNRNNNHRAPPLASNEITKPIHEAFALKSSEFKQKPIGDSRIQAGAQINAFYSVAVTRTGWDTN